MALKSTVWKVALTVSDLDRSHFADYSLTVAQHPSETSERVMLRLLAFALHASEDLRFGKGISTDDEPALWEIDPAEFGLTPKDLNTHMLGKDSDHAVREQT